MVGSLNKVILVGNLGQDPEVRTMQSGDKVANLNIATSERWRDKDGQRQEKTEWHRVSMFGKLAEIAEQYLHKGSKVLVEGRLQTRKWQDKNGNDRYTTEVIISGFNGNMVMLDSRSGDSGGGGGNYESSSQGGGGGSGGGGGGGSYDNSPSQANDQDGFEDDIPF